VLAAAALELQVGVVLALAAVDRAAAQRHLHAVADERAALAVEQLDCRRRW